MADSNTSGNDAKLARERWLARVKLRSALINLAEAETMLKKAGAEAPASLREETPMEGISDGPMGPAEAWE